MVTWLRIMTWLCVGIGLIIVVVGVFAVIGASMPTASSNPYSGIVKTFGIYQIVGGLVLGLVGGSLFGALAHIARKLRMLTSEGRQPSLSAQ